MWPRIVNALLGVWLMAAPAVLGYGVPAETNDRIVGPLLASVAVVAAWEVTRPLRWINVVLGLWLLLAPGVLGYRSAAPVANSLLVSLAVIGCGMVRGDVRERFGGGWSALWRGAGGRGQVA